LRPVNQQAEALEQLAGAWTSGNHGNVGLLTILTQRIVADRRVRRDQ
jgi:hypothetical protein